MKIIFLILLLLVSVTSDQAQEPKERCIPNRNAPPISPYYWPPDTEVKVYVMRNKFTGEQLERLIAAMSIWSSSSAETGAGIKFTYAGEVDNTQTCNGCLTVTRREVFKRDRKHYAFFNPLERDEHGLLTAAWIDLDFATVNPEALQGYMVHELGHGMGLWDCPTCSKHKTIMNLFPGINQHNGLIEPSSCDLEVVRIVYMLQRAFKGYNRTKQ